MSTAIDYITRSNINVAIVDMVLPLNNSDTNATDHELGICPSRDHQSRFSLTTAMATPLINIDFLDNAENGTELLNQAKQYERYDWNAQVQGIVLSSFFVFYIIMQVPAGRAAEVYGGKWIIAFSIVGSGVINLVTPVIASSLVLLVVSRLALGFVQGGVYPAAYALVRDWTPLSERSLSFAMLDLGGTVGTVVGSAVSGYLAAHSGWPSIFYVSGVMGLVGFVLWMLLGSSRPETSRFISKRELEFLRPIEDTMETQLIPNDAKKSRPKVPWLRIITTPGVIGLLVSKSGHAFAGYMIVSKLPTFLNDVLRVDPAKVSL